LATTQQQRQRRRQQQPAPPVTQPAPPPLTQIQQLALRIAGQLAQHLAAHLALAAIAAILWPVVVPALALIALGIVLRIIEKYQLPPLEGVSDAQRYVIWMNELRRAMFVINATRRVLAALEAGESQDVVALREERYYKQHVVASHQRVQAATKLDALAELYGPILGWYARNDKKTTPECRAADGKNFWATTPPAIGWPGMVHVQCRCYGGKPHRRGVMLP
jgi:hypothetical protein